MSEDSLPATYAADRGAPASPLPKAAASNTEDAFRELIGGRIVGVMRNAMPPHRPNGETTTIVMHDGSGFTFNHRHGSFWRENVEDVQQAITAMRRRVEQASGDYERILALSGAVSIGDAGAQRSTSTTVGHESAASGTGEDAP